MERGDGVSDGEGAGSRLGPTMTGARDRSRHLARQVRAAVPFSTRKLPEDDTDFESRLVWILGSPRTGSTWLLRLLIHPFLLARLPTGVKAPPSLGRRERPAIVPVNESHVCQHLTPTTLDRKLLLNRGLQDHPSYLFADAYAESWRPKVRDLVLTRLRAQAEAGADQLGIRDPHVVVKEPQSRGAEFLMSFLPSSRLLFLVRDGREVVRSMLALYGPGGRLEGTSRAPRDESPDARLRFVKNQSRRWVQRMQSVNAAYLAHSPESRIMVRYEQLTGDTPRELRRLFDWMGLDRTDEQVRTAVESELARRRPTGTGRRDDRDPSFWELSPEERAAAEEIMGPVLAELGYPAKA